MEPESTFCSHIIPRLVCILEPQDSGPHPHTVFPYDCFEYYSLICAYLFYGVWSHQKIHLSPRPYIMLYYTLLFVDELLASCLNPTLQYYPLLAVCERLFDIHRYSPYFKAVFSNCSSRTCHVVMTRNPHNMETYAFNSSAEHNMLLSAIAVVLCLMKNFKAINFPFKMWKLMYVQL